MISKKKIIILLILTIIGLLSALSILTKTMNIDVPITDPLCKIGKIEDNTTTEEKYLFNCEEFDEKNPRSNILGLPQSILATSIYAGMLLFLIIALFVKKDNTIKLLIIPFIASIFNLVYSLFVAVFVYIIGGTPPFCLYSTIMYVCNILIFILLIAPYMKSLTDSIKGAIKSPFYIIIPLSIILLCVGSVILISYSIENKSLTMKDIEEIEANLSKDEYPIDTEGASVRGKNELGVEIVVFEDFQCPACRRTAPIFDKLLKHYDNKISFIFKHYPLEPECFPIQIEPLHELACEASYASLAAREQGKFWEYYDLLYSDKVDNTDIFEKYAKELNLDLEKFKTDYESERIRNGVKRDTAEGHYALRLTSTPSVFINKRLWKGVKDFSTLRKVIEYFKTRNVVVDKNTTEEYNPIDYLSKEPVKINTENSPTIGQNELGVEIVVFEDFQCPACRKTSEEIKKLLEHYNYKISLTFKHYPLEPECFPKEIMTLHEWACELSYASMAAERQGKFWEYYKALFSDEIRSVPIRLNADFFNNFIIANIKNENDKKLILDRYKEKDGEYLLKTDTLPEDKDKIVEILKSIGYAKYIIDEYAKKLNLDMEKFNEDYNSEEIRNFIKRDTEEGFNRFNITSTPSIFFNGRYYDGYKEVKELIKVVDYIINEKNTPNS